jgi:hypothetical protein
MPTNIMQHPVATLMGAQIAYNTNAHFMSALQMQVQALQTHLESLPKSTNAQERALETSLLTALGTLSQLIASRAGYVAVHGLT